MKVNYRWWAVPTALLLGVWVSACTEEPTELTAPENPVSFDVTGTPNKQFWKQCQNNHDYTYACSWVTGNLNQTHNSWAEGDFVPKVLRINKINNTDPFVITMTYGFLKGGKTTHDFLGDWNLTQTGANPCVDSSFNVSPFCAGGILAPIDAISNLMGPLSLTAVTNACGGGSQYVTDMTEAIAGAGAGNLFVSGINVDAIVVNSIVFDGCPATGDAEATMTLTITPQADAVGGANSAGVLLLFGAHVARSFDWDNGGASNVQGSPYHLGLITVDGESAGSMDLQMAAASVIVPATKAGTKFEDLDADGANREAGEPGLAGWTIYVDYDDDGVLDVGEPSAVTDANGDYLITGITPGTYKVREVAQAGWTCSYPNPCYHNEVFAEGANLTGNNFGNYTTTSKSGMKFNDLDADGVKDAGEPGLAGWVIFVDYDDDGVLDAGEPSATTIAGGTYSITGINPGTWKVKEVAQAGWTCSYPNPCYHQELFQSGVPQTGNDFGNYTTASKSGMKFEDLDADGVKDAGEPGLAGWVIFVDYDDDGVLDAGEPSATTIAGGTYSITGINPGTYKVREVAQAGWTCSYPNPCYHEETFQSGSAFTDNDFGNWTTATKSGTKFNDVDGDGVWDAGEPGLAGWVIFVDYDDDGVLDAGEPNATTAADGTYTITGINPGTWKVKEVAQAGWTCTYPNPCYHEETFESSDALTDNNFGNWMPPVVNTETAWASNALGACCTLPFNPGGGGSWATYVAYAGVLKTVTLYAGQTTAVGTVSFTPGPGAGEVTIQVNLTGGWTFAEGSVVAVQTYASAPSGNPSPGQFTYKSAPLAAGSTTVSIVVPVANFYAVHAVVE